jgi:hypothetical protein
VAAAHPGRELLPRGLYVEGGPVLAEEVHAPAPVDLEHERLREAGEVEIGNPIPDAVELVEDVRADAFGDVGPDRELVGELGHERGAVVQHEPVELLVEGPRVAQVESPAEDALEAAGQDDTVGHGVGERPPDAPRQSPDEPSHGSGHAVAGGSSSWSPQ